MRIVTWNCNMALHRKFDALLGLRPDIAVICECATPGRLRERGLDLDAHCHALWAGQNLDKGLGVLAFNEYRIELAEPYYPTLRYVMPVHVSGPLNLNFLGVWAQNLSGGNTRKLQAGPLRRGLTKYKDFLTARPAIVAGDLNNNVIWDKPGWRINHANVVSLLDQMGMASAYHTVLDERQGEETMPTIYWRDRKKDGPTYHLDYVFVPRFWTDTISEMTVGSFETWCGSGLSDHVPVVVELQLPRE